MSSSNEYRFDIPGDARFVVGFGKDKEAARLNAIANQKNIIAKAQQAITALKKSKGKK